MAILKFINSFVDFSTINGATSTLSTYFTPQRVKNGYAFTANDGWQTSWPAPAGNTVWIHHVYGQSTTSTGYDEPNVMNFTDANGTTVIDFDVENGVNTWTLLGDTSSSVSITAAANVRQICDISFTKNGTTDLTMSIYINGTLRGTRTVANTFNRGVPTGWNGSFIDSGTFYFGECVIADEDTRGWRFYWHDPESYGVEQDFTGDANAAVSETLVTGIRSNTLDDRASFGVAKLENLAPSTNIDRVCIQSYMQRGSTGLSSFNHMFRYQSGTITDDVDVGLTESTDLYVSEYTTSPDTGLAWTDTEMQGLQPGVRART